MLPYFKTSKSTIGNNYNQTTILINLKKDIQHLQSKHNNLKFARLQKFLLNLNHKL